MANKYIRLGYTGAGGGGSSFVKDPVANPAALPSSGNNAGDLRYALSVNQWYKWNGTAWSSWVGDLDPSKAMITDVNGLPDSSAVTTTELGYVAGVTSGIQSQINTVATKASDLVTLSGVAANSANLGTFTGTIIPDNSTNKSALQSLETASDLITDVNWTGDYNNGVTYTVGDGVMFNGASFRMIIAIGAAGYNPVAYPANWLQVTDYVSPNDIGLGNVDNVSDANKPISTATQTALDLKVDENSPITGATKTKLTYDAKGLVTAGADATTADIADSTNRRYVTDADLIDIGNLSGVNTGDQNLSGYELLSNKASDLLSPDNTKYPTTLAVQTALDSFIAVSPIYILSGINSDISGYESAIPLSSYIPAALSTVSRTVTTSETILEEFATNLGLPNLNAIPVVIFSIHYETQKSSGSRFYYTYVKLFKRSSGGTETLLLTSDLSDQFNVNTVLQNTVTALSTTIIPLLTTDRLVVKIYARTVTGSDTITLRWDDATDARFQLPGSSLTYVPENIANKVTSLTSPDDIKYPSALAVSTALALKADKSTGDLSETNFSMANNQISPADVTGFAFNAASVRSFSATVSVAVDATSDLFEAFTLTGINRGGSFDIAISSVGDASGVTLSCTSAGQVQYQTPNYSGFVSGALRFRAITTAI